MCLLEGIEGLPFCIYDNTDVRQYLSHDPIKRNQKTGHVSVHAFCAWVIQALHFDLNMLTGLYKPIVLWQDVKKAHVQTVDVFCSQMSRVRHNQGKGLVTRLYRDSPDNRVI